MMRVGERSPAFSIHGKISSLNSENRSLRHEKS